jgi:predicted dehydrogenase
MIQLGIIGAGKIVPFHIDALLAAGFSINGICSTPGSLNSRRIAEKYKIPNVYDHIPNLINSKIGAILIAVPKEILLPVLSHALMSDKKILIEKPLFMGSEKYKLPSHAVDRVMVAYNRRYYKTVQAFKSRVKTSKSGTFLFRIPELSFNPQPTKTEILETLKGNTVHYFDLINFIFESHSPRYRIIERSNSLKNLRRNIFFEYDNYDGIVDITFGVPGNYRLDFMNHGLCSSLSPIELFTEFDGMTVAEPTNYLPIRTYSPTNSKTDYRAIVEDSKYKPGFLAQSLDFFNFVTNGHSETSASIIDAASSAKIADTIAFMP